MSDAGGDAEVVELFPDAEAIDHDQPLRLVRKEGFCSHRRVELVSDSRRVFCRDCAAEVDAFDALLDIARVPERYIESRKAAKREARRAHSELDEVKRELRNAKARLRRAQR